MRSKPSISDTSEQDAERLVNVRGLALACQQPIKESGDRDRKHDARRKDLPMGGKQSAQIVPLCVVGWVDADHSG